MTPEQIIAIAATGVVGMLSFFLRSAFATITHRLDKLESALVELIAETRAGNITSTNNTSEIALLRTRQHELSNELQIVKAIQQRCKHCNGG
jgi:hypothetical protein